MCLMYKCSIGFLISFTATILLQYRVVDSYGCGPILCNNSPFHVISFVVSITKQYSTFIVDIVMVD